MNKRLSAKIQQLNAPTVLQGRAFSSCINVEPEEQNLILKKGIIYGIFDIASTEEIDSNLVKTIIHDSIKESYFQSESISPIQSLEKAIIDVKEKVTHLLIKSPEHKVNFNLLTGVLWGNVLYVVQFGEGACYLVRQGEIRPINTMSEGSFAAASGVVKDEDVVIFSTKQFNEKYPPNKLLSMAISEQSLLPSESCALLKFIVDTSFTQDEIVDFGLEEASNNQNKVKDLFVKIADKAKETRKKIQGTRKEKNTPEQTTSIRLKPERKSKMGLKIAIPVLLIALSISIFFTIKNKNKKDEQKNTQTKQEQDVKAAEDVKVVVEEPKDNLENIFYDLKITDSQANPSEIEVFENNIVVADKTTGKLYISERQTAKFLEMGSNFAGINSLQKSDKDLFFADNEGFKYFNIEKKAVSQSFKQITGDTSAIYLGYIYTVKDGAVFKYTESGEGTATTLQEANWGKIEGTEKAISMAVAYNIYMLSETGKLNVYTSGEKANFELTGLETPLNNAKKVVTNTDLDNIYFADSGNKRVVVVDKEGKFIKEIKSPSSKEWEDLRDIGVSPDETKMFVLNGSKVYEISL